MTVLMDLYIYRDSESCGCKGYYALDSHLVNRNDLSTKTVMLEIVIAEVPILL